MRFVTLASVLIGLSLVPGCGVVASRVPIYDSNRDVVFDSRLLGTWSSDDQGGEQLIQLARGDGDHYIFRPVTTQPADTQPSAPSPAFDLVQLGRYRYLFLSATSSEFGTILFPGYQVRFRGDDLCLSMLNSIEFQNELDAHPTMLKYEDSPTSLLLGRVESPTSKPGTTQPEYRHIILIDEPERIRQVLISHEDDPLWFGTGVVFHRVVPIKGK